MKNVLLLILFLSSSLAADHPWIRAGLNTNAPLWGVRGGLQFALHPAGFSGRNGGPRGLIRIGYPTLTNSAYDLINFIAVEPIVAGRKGFSELERSSFDGKPGKLFWTGALDEPATNTPHLDPGKIISHTNGVEELSVTVFVERFDNGAHVRLTLSQRTDAPNELRLTIHPEEGTAEIETCILTATMGNKARARIVNLADGPVSSLQLYPDYRDIHFAPHTIYPLERLPRADNGDVLVSIANDEPDPARIQPFGRPHFWDYRGRKVTQYWRKPAAQITPDITCALNARHTYWGGRQPIPGGNSFENFELRQTFHANQTFIFGISE